MSLSGQLLSPKLSLLVPEEHLSFCCVPLATKTGVLKKPKCCLERITETEETDLVVESLLKLSREPFEELNQMSNLSPKQFPKSHNQKIMDGDYALTPIAMHVEDLFSREHAFKMAKKLFFRYLEYDRYAGKAFEQEWLDDIARVELLTFEQFNEEVDNDYFNDIRKELSEVQKYYQDFDLRVCILHYHYDNYIE